MAKITHLPSKEIIDGFKGTIDFYLHDGQPCARKWPCSPGRVRSPAVMAQWPAFAFAGHYWQFLPADIREAFNEMAVGLPLTGRELFTKSFINTLTVRFV